ncbi:MAG TPA: BatA domain-containing protein [Planctomycetota bacterium]|nr:BatA domain-containing protein [Planctomycetota bacterium]
MFVTPVFLVGALLAVIPVIIHLFFRRRAPQMYFSTIRFLQLCVRKAARRKRIENLLLLLFRMLLFGLLAVALARPFFRSSVAGGSGPASAVIILDNSYSMATRQQGMERFAQAKDIARTLVREMSERDSVALILTGGPRAGDKVQLTHRLNDVHSAIAQAEIFAGYANVTTAVNRAFEALRTSGDVSREVVVVTDLQEKSLEGELGAAARGEKDVPLIFYDCGQEAVVNLAVTGLTFKGGTRLGGTLSTLVVQVYNPTDGEIRDARLTLYVDNKAVKEQRVTVQGRARTPVHFRYPFTEARTVTGWVQLSDDSLAFDNRCNFRIAASDRIRVLVLRDEQAAISYLDEGYYVVRALDPHTADDAGGVSPIAPVLRLTGELDKAVLEEFGAVFFMNVHGLDLTSVSKLRRYVETGGMVVFFMGDRVDPSRYGGVFLPSGTGLFPANLGRAVGDDRKRQDVWQMRPPDFAWGGFARLKAVPPALFERVRAYRFFTIDGWDAAKVQVLAALSSETAAPASAPLLASASLGDGEVFFFSVPGTTGWTTFPATKVFVPMLHEMVYAVTGKTGRLESVTAGQPRRFDFADVQGEVTVSVEVRPGTTEVRKSTHDASGNFVLFESTWRPGIYRYVLAGAREGEDYFVVNPDTRESELARMSDAALEGKFSATKMLVVRSPEQLTAERLRLREGRPLAGYVFLLVITVAGFELFLANRTRPAQVEGRPRTGATA